MTQSRRQPSEAKGGRSIMITRRMDGLFCVERRGPLPPRSFLTPHIASAHGLVPENRANSLERLTGVESLRRRHS